MNRICYLIWVLLFSVSYLAAEKPSPYGSNYKEKVLYEVDTKRAADLEQAWSGLQRYVDRDHYVAVFFVTGSSQYKNYKLVELQRHGALVNIKLENIDDDDIWTVLTIRASSISKLQILEED